MLRRRWLSSIGLVASLSAVILVSLPAIRDAAADTRAVASSPDEPDIDAAAKLLDVSVDEAAYRIKIQQEVGSLEAALDVDLHDVLGSVWITQEPKFGVNVSVLSGSEKLIQPYLVGTDLESITTVSTARRSLSTLQSETRAFLDANPNFENYDLSIDETLGYIDVVAPSEEALGRLEVARESVTDEILNDFHFELGELAQPATDVIGGRVITDNDGTCTAGFVVREDAPGTRDGVIDAGHCGQSGAVWNHQVDLNFQEQALGSTHDVQWFTSPGTDDKPWFSAGDGGSIRHVLSTTNRANTSIGDLVCKNGNTLGYACGEVIHKDVCPNYVPGCYPTFIQADTNGQKMCGPGDSGGPVFWSNSAYGIVSGYVTDDDQDCIYMAVNYVSDGVYVHVRIAAS